MEQADAKIDRTATAASGCRSPRGAGCSMIEATAHTRRRLCVGAAIPDTRSMALFWLLLEAAVALALLLFIVWWTWPRGKRHTTERGGHDASAEQRPPGRSDDT
jgi:hypothetical protein